MAKNATKLKPPLIGTGRFQWSGPAWVGATLGSSFFLVPVTAFLVYHSQTTLALLPMAAFLILAMTGFALWQVRQSIYPFSALMYFLALYALLIPAVWLVIGESAQKHTLLAMNWPNTAIANIIVLLMAPLAMLGIWIGERKSRIKPKLKNAE